MSATDLYGLLPLVALAVFCIGAALVEASDLPHATRIADFVGIGLMIISMSAGIAMAAIHTSPAVTEGISTLSCLHNHSINHCALSKL